MEEGWGTGTELTKEGTTTGGGGGTTGGPPENGAAKRDETEGITGPSVGRTFVGSESGGGGAMAPMKVDDAALEFPVGGISCNGCDESEYPDCRIWSPFVTNPEKGEDGTTGEGTTMPPLLGVTPWFGM